MHELLCPVFAGFHVLRGISETQCWLGYIPLPSIDDAPGPTTESLDAFIPRAHRRDFQDHWTPLAPACLSILRLQVNL